MRNAKHKPLIRECLSFGENEYSLSQIVKATGLERKYVRQRLWRFEKAEDIDIVGSRELAPKDSGRSTLEIFYRNTGLLTKKPAKQQKEATKDLWDKMWKAVRALRRFTRNDLVQVCEANPGAVKAFAQECHKSGYIRPARGHKNNITWMLIKDPGPKRPVPEASDVD